MKPEFKMKDEHSEATPPNLDDTTQHLIKAAQAWSSARNLEAFPGSTVVVAECPTRKNQTHRAS